MPPEVNEAPVAPTQTINTTALDSNKPLSQQTANIMKIMESMPDKKEEVPAEIKGGKTPPETKEEPNEVIETPNDDSFMPDDEDEREVTPFEVKTWQEYVSSNVQPITITGKVGNEVKEFKVFTEDQLPADFEFRSDVDRMKYARAFDRLERKAEVLQQEFYRRQQNENIRQFEIQEAKDVSSDLKWLQSRGVIPKFEYDDTDPRFNSDPSVKEANAIYDLYKRVNQEYANKYMDSNRSYRISFRDAADKFYAMRGREAKPIVKTNKPAKTPIQQQRDNINSKSAPQGGDAHAAKPKAFRGMSFNDINRLAKAGKI